MKQISVEDIRFMRLRYKHDVALVRVLDELLEYRDAEEQAGNEVARAYSHIHGVEWKPGSKTFLPKFPHCKECNEILSQPIDARTELERECGPLQDPLQWREH